jgi:hypothetical protein
MLLDRGNPEERAPVPGRSYGLWPSQGAAIVDWLVEQLGVRP